MLEPTESLALSKCRQVFLRRNLPTEFDLDTISGMDLQELRIDVKTYRLIFTYTGELGQSFWYQMVVTPEQREKNTRAAERESKRRSGIFEEKFVKNPKWMGQEGEEAGQRRLAAWDEAVQTGLWKMGELLDRANEAAVPMESVEPMETEA